MKDQFKDKVGIKAVVVDDEKHAVEALTEMLSVYEGVEIAGWFSDPEEAVSGILELRPNLVFLDIKMPGMTGFEILRRVSEEGFEPAVIFVTAYEEYAIEAIRHAAFDYILKPVEREELYQALLRFTLTYSHVDLNKNYRKLLDSTDRELTIKLPVDAGFRIFKLSDIVYIECDHHWTRIWTAKDTFHLVTASLGYIEKRLPADHFFRISVDVIVHLKYLKKVKKLARQCILQKNGHTFTVPGSFSRLRMLEKHL